MVLDLFAGLRGWSAPFEERGHRTFSIDINHDFDVDLHADILQITPGHVPFKPDVILASPPCQGFSVMQIGRNWTRDHKPKTPKAQMAVALVERTLWLIQQLKPRFYVIENPRAKLRKMPQMEDLDRRTVTYCRFGERRMKPTDLWGGFPPSLVLPPPCKNGDSCHDAAPRGSRTGTQGMDSATAAKIPHGLALAFCLALENDLGGTVAAPMPKPLVAPVQEELWPQN